MTIAKVVNQMGYVTLGSKQYKKVRILSPFNGSPDEFLVIPPTWKSESKKHRQSWIMRAKDLEKE